MTYFDMFYIIIILYFYAYRKQKFNILQGIYKIYGHIYGEVWRIQTLPEIFD